MYFQKYVLLLKYKNKVSHILFTNNKIKLEKQIYFDENY